MIDPMRIASLLALAAGLYAADKPHVVFVTGDDEYRSEETMPALAKVLESKYGMRCSVAYARPTPQTKNNIEGLQALKTADLMVVYLRFRELPDDQLKLILDYTDSGKPMVGLRTATHAFRYPACVGQSCVRKQDDKFLPADPCQDVSIPLGFQNHLRQGFQSVVAAPVPVCIVDALEMVNIEHDEAEICLLSDRPGDLIFQIF
jgi:hypothetical protein